MTATVDLNADMGEGWGAYAMGDDAALLDVVTTANVACGFHGGDPLVMHRTITAAKARGVEVGGHPGFLDPWGFGRRRLPDESPSDVEKLVVYQLGAIRAVAAFAGHAVTHVKPHGTLNTMANTDADLAAAIVRAVKAVDPGFVLVAMPGTELERAGERAGLRVAREIFADRAYGDDGNLVPRKVPGAMIHDVEAAAERVLRMVLDGEVVALSGKRLRVGADTICVHGDNPAAIAMARAVRSRLEAAGVSVAPLTRVLSAKGR
ncbi:MAG TPA: 5-oxoprolinase subunit PxpA [Azospirillaceae bacterium]|nr:5-oxoprolinase subunit PxpA [Azospirillaceae bacterium]